MAESFYETGLRFGCQRCSSCCRGGPGYVFLAREDLKRLLSHLSLDFPGFFAEYCTVVDTGLGFALSLAEQDNYDCIFWSERGCRVYEHRPLQCSTYPFWSSILDSRQNWEEAGQDCPGIGRGELRSREEIEEALFRRRSAGTILLSREEVEHPETIDEDTLLGR